MPQDAVNEVVNDLSKWAESSAFTDDVSVVVIEWLG